MGEVLIVATVVLGVGIIAAALEPELPEDPVRPQLVWHTVCANQVWGDGDEVLILEHQGGDPLVAEHTGVRVRIAGVVVYDETGRALGHGFADGILATGDRWQGVFGLAPGTRADVQVRYEHTGGSWEVIEQRPLHDYRCIPNAVTVPTSPPPGPPPGPAVCPPPPSPGPLGVVTFDSGGAPGSPTGTTASEKVRVEDGHGRLLVVSVVDSDRRVAAAVDWVRYDGTDLTRVVRASDVQGGLSDHGAEVWVLVDPPVGNKDLEVHWPGAVDGWVVAATTYYGINATDPVKTSATAIGDAYLATKSLNTLSDQAVIVAAIVHEVDTARLDGLGNVTKRFDVGVAGELRGAGGDLRVTPAGTHTVSFLATNVPLLPGDREWALALVELRGETPAGPGVCPLSGGGIPTPIETIDFNVFGAGAVVDEVYTDTGKGPVTLDGQNPLFPGQNAAITYDSSCPVACSGGDVDLGTPHLDFGGPGVGLGGASGQPFANHLPLGNLLIVAENLVDGNGDGLIDVPDDQGGVSSTIVFDFSAIAPVRMMEMKFLDSEETAPNSLVELFDASGDLLASISAADTGDNGMWWVSLGQTPGVHSMHITLGGSGAIDDIVLSTV